MNLHILLNGFETVTLFFVFSSTYQSAKTCIISRRPETGELECCVNYYYEDNQCLDCKLGTYGTNCNETCPRGNFGVRCGGVCTECSPLECRSDYGCPTKKTGPVTNQTTTTHSHDSEGTASGFIIIYGNSIIALLIGLIIIVSVRKFSVFKNKRGNVEGDTIPLDTEKLSHTEAFEIEERGESKKSSKKQTKSRYNASVSKENDTVV